MNIFDDRDIFLVHLITFQQVIWLTGYTSQCTFCDCKLRRKLLSIAYVDEKTKAFAQQTAVYLANNDPFELKITDGYD